MAFASIDNQIWLRDAVDYAQDRWDALLIRLGDLPFARERRRTMSRLGLTVNPQVFYQERELARELRSLLEAQRYDVIEQQFEDVFAGRQVNDFGVPLYNLYEQAMLPDALAGGVDTYWTHAQLRKLKSVIPLFEQWWQARRGDPFAAAAYAQAYSKLVSITSDLDGGPAFEKLNWQYVDIQQRVLEESRDAGESRYCWQRAFYQLISSDDSYDSFEQMLAFDPDNLWLYQTQLHYHRPIWGGTSGSAEQFIRWAMTKVQKIPPHELYARLYLYWFTKYTSTYEESAADWGLMKTGFESMLEKYSSPLLVNFYAGQAYEVEDYQKVCELFETHLKTLVPQCWADCGVFSGTVYAMDAYETACEECDGLGTGNE